MYIRHLQRRLENALTDTPIVLLTGARQTGKTTLARQLSTGTYATLDDLETLAAATGDPTGFLAGLAAGGEPVVIDEVQRAPKLLLALKASVDRDRRPGRFLLTGSANVFTVPGVSESLAGRMEIQTLWPLAQSEIEGLPANLVDLLFADESPLSTLAPVLMDTSFGRDELVRRILAGGYPEPRARDDDRRREWFSSYLASLLQRDLRDLTRTEGVAQLPRVLNLLATRVGGLLNVSDISRTMDIPLTTLQRYLGLLQTIYLAAPLPPWSSNLGSRLLKAPKMFLNDTGLAASLLGVDSDRILAQPQLLGGLLENFVVAELWKEIAVSRVRPTAFHWHTVNRQEVDILLEAPDGRLVGIEIKSSATIGGDAFSGLRALQSSVGERLTRGIVLYAGPRVVPFAENLFAVPLGVLWNRNTNA